MIVFFSPVIIRIINFYLSKVPTRSNLLSKTSIKVDDQSIFTILEKVSPDTQKTYYYCKINTHLSPRPESKNQKYNSFVIHYLAVVISYTTILLL